MSTVGLGIDAAAWSSCASAALAPMAALRTRRVSRTSTVGGSGSSLYGTSGRQEDMAAIVARQSQYVKIRAISLHVTATCQVSCIDDLGVEWLAVRSGFERRCLRLSAGHAEAALSRGCSAGRPGTLSSVADEGRCWGVFTCLALGGRSPMSAPRNSSVREAPRVGVGGTTWTTVGDRSSTARLASLCGYTAVKSDDVTRGQRRATRSRPSLAIHCLIAAQPIEVPRRRWRARHTSSAERIDCIGRVWVRRRCVARSAGQGRW